MSCGDRVAKLLLCSVKLVLCVCVVQSCNYRANNSVFPFDRQRDYNMVSGDDDRGGGVGDRHTDGNTAVPQTQEKICSHMAKDYFSQHATRRATHRVKS